MKTRIAITVAAMLFAGGTAYAAMTGDCCQTPDCCADGAPMGHHGTMNGHPAAPAQPKA